MRKTIIFFIFLFFVANLSFAQEGNLSLRLEQTKVKLLIPPGGSKAGEIKIYSQSGEPMTLRVYVEDWAYTSEQDGSKEFFPMGTHPFSCSPWIRLNPTELTLPAYGVGKVNYVVNVPLDATGGHFAVLFFESGYIKPEKGKAGQEEIKTGLGLSIRIGSLIYVEAKDTVRRSAELSGLLVTKNKYLDVSCDFKNTGNTYITSGGTFHMMDKNGLIQARQEFNDIFTFPGDSGKISAAWKNPIPKGKYDLVITLDLGKAQEEAGISRGPTLVKEAEIEIGDEGQVLKIGELK